ncbi:MAG: hypothetical protein UX36_C0006G0007 [Microgenomates group bacterium GW2011_GWC1_46_15]|nr:MAG: hypothetical protein UX36_C0006G0007 [Microgenomates group bacterium GW2011_GWC1_46_15]
MSQTELEKKIKQVLDGYFGSFLLEAMTPERLEDILDLVTLELMRELQNYGWVDKTER